MTRAARGSPGSSWLHRRYRLHRTFRLTTSHLLHRRPSARAETRRRMEITLPGGVTLRVDADVDGATLRRVLAVLEKR
jgi:hypothetical protein